MNNPEVVVEGAMMDSQHNIEYVSLNVSVARLTADREANS